LTCKNRLPYNLYCVGGDVNTAQSSPLGVYYRGAGVDSTSRLGGIHCSCSCKLFAKFGMTPQAAWSDDKFLGQPHPIPGPSHYAYHRANRSDRAIRRGPIRDDVQALWSSGQPYSVAACTDPREPEFCSSRDRLRAYRPTLQLLSLQIFVYELHLHSVGVMGSTKCGADRGINLVGS